MDLVAVGLVTLGAVVLFVTGRLRPDLVARLLVVALAATGLVSPEEALSGFASPATVIVLAMLILAGGLNRTGATRLVGQASRGWPAPGSGADLHIRSGSWTSGPAAWPAGAGPRRARV
jgi:di/tricarboxylate transporter